MFSPYISIYVTSLLYIGACDINGNCNITLISIYFLLAIVIEEDVGV